MPQDPDKLYVPGMSQAYGVGQTLTPNDARSIVNNSNGRLTLEPDGGITGPNPDQPGQTITIPANKPLTDEHIHALQHGITP